MFSAAGWHVLEAKYGRRLQARFAGPGGGALKRRIDDMANEEYQVLIRRPGPEARDPAHRGRAGLAPRRPGDRRSPTSPTTSCRASWRTSAGTTSTSSSAASRAADRGADPLDGPVRLHDQGLAAAVRGRQPEPLGAAERGSDRDARPAPGRRSRAIPWAGVRARLARRPAVREAAARPRVRAAGRDRRIGALPGADRGARATSGSRRPPAPSRHSATRWRRSPATRSSGPGS